MAVLNNKIVSKLLIRIGFWFPILFMTFSYINDYNFYIIYGNIILALTIILFANLLNNNRLNLIVEAFGVVFFNVILFVQLAHYHLFHDHIKASTFFIIFDSNFAETSEFLSMYIDFTIVLIFLLLFTGAFLSIFFRFKNSASKLNLRLKLIYLSIIFVSLLNNNIRGNTFPYTVFSAFKEYKSEKNTFDQITQNKFGGDFSQVTHTSRSEDEIYLLILGESTTRSHMQLYNYYRDTNPKLSARKENLMIYKDVVSPHTHTYTSLLKVLTLASNEFPDKKYSGSIIQLFNKAGFKTYWLSNQIPMGIYDTNTTIISKSSDQQIFVNTGEKSLDNMILNPLEKILKQKNKKKFIVIHLMGTHGEYAERYPKSFERFNSKPKTKFNHERAYKIINAYDNAILYNDFIINEIITKIERTNSKSYALYISDHGEDVFETMDAAAHTESKGSKPMYDIPFIFWRSEKFKLGEKRYVYDVDRKYSTENLLYTLSDLASVSFKEFDSTKSLVNKRFIQKDRIIRNNVDYDVFFNKK